MPKRAASPTTNSALRTPQSAIQISPTTARRIAILRQRLAGPRPDPTPEGILEIARSLRALQLDPINVVSRSHTLVLWSRLGVYDPAHIETVLYRDKHLFEFWAHCASLVLTEDYPIHHLMMRERHSGDGAWETRSREWLEANHDMVDEIRTRLRTEGPLQLNAFEDRAVRSWQSTGWTSGRNVARAIDHLWLRGEAVVVGRNGITASGASPTSTSPPGPART
ncbi:MAG: crosslink repair DNA glycosylase YcaQ family protein [Chloroflexia bacterium]